MAPFTLVTMLGASSCVQETEENKPKLIVQITIDQFKSDYLDRFGAAFQQGIKRITDDGLVIKNGVVDHAITDSFPGHGSLATGMYPKNHGFSANSWWGLQDGSWRSISSANDPSTTIIGTDGLVGTSTLHFRATSIADWAKSTDETAKAIALSAGTKISMPYGGRSADAIYWLDRPSGRFVSSDFYINSYPDWVNRFNDETMTQFKNRVWENSVPINLRALAGPDDVSYENNGRNYTFPHSSEQEKSTSPDLSEEEKYNSWFYDTPMADEALFELAMATIINENMGADQSVDYLSITVNTTDNVGHAFGGRSQEILDTMVRVDRKIGELLTFLDREIGAGNYVVAVSGDHGGPDIIEYSLENDVLAERISQRQVDELLDHVEREVLQSDLSRDEMIANIEIIMESYPFIEDAITQREIDFERPNENPFLDVYRKSWVQGRVPAFPLRAVGTREHHPARYGIFAQFKENVFYDAAPVVHGSPFGYDVDVPVMFIGAGVSKIMVPDGTTIKTIDVAPTLGAIGGLRLPDNLDGAIYFNPAE